MLVYSKVFQNSVKSTHNSMQSFEEKHIMSKDILIDIKNNLHY